jgi:CheY-like chemotaxis protein
MQPSLELLDDEVGEETTSPDDVDDVRTTNRLRAKDRRPRRVALVVDDSEDAQELCREALEDTGYHVQCAPNGQDALQLLIAMPTPTVIILDVLMPAMGGLELLDIIRAYRRLADVPVVIITAGEDLDAFFAPSTTVLKKPFDCDHLIDAIDSLIGDARL